MTKTYLNRLYKTIKTDTGVDCGIISFHQHGDIIAIGASKVRPKFIDTDKFRFDVSKGKKIADSRAKKAFSRYMNNLATDDPSIRIIDLSKDKSFSSLKDIVEKTEAIDYAEEETKQKQLAIYI